MQVKRSCLGGASNCLPMIENALLQQTAALHGVRRRPVETKHVQRKASSPCLNPQPVGRHDGLLRKLPSADNLVAEKGPCTDLDLALLPLINAAFLSHRPSASVLTPLTTILVSSLTRLRGCLLQPRALPRLQRSLSAHFAAIAKSPVSWPDIVKYGRPHLQHSRPQRKRIAVAMSSSDDDTPLVRGSNQGQCFVQRKGNRLTRCVAFLSRDGRSRPPQASTSPITLLPCPSRCASATPDMAKWLTIFPQQSPVSVYPRQKTEPWTPRSLPTATSSQASPSEWAP